jgi:RNA-directed DNA polymerase
VQVDEEWPVSAVKASSTPGVETLDAVRALQHALYRAAKADPGGRFHALYDKVRRRDVLQRAWGQVRRNHGGPGVDQTTLADVEEYGVSRLLDELEAELKADGYRPVAAAAGVHPQVGSSEAGPGASPGSTSPAGPSD